MMRDVLPTGKYFADLRCLFEMMFRTLSAGEPNAELFCSSLMHALLVSVLTVTAGPRAGVGKAAGGAAHSRQTN